ncbi:MAG: hypothetical protein JW944_08020 [Deltaproteobacteria bacterium]|nr:hypothetical protein [Deltaproteobacteria bacterium]
MNILYGVQATGNGHISRSREVVRNLKNAGHNVATILSGREPSLLWDMGDFEPYISQRGITFATGRGRLQYFKTAFELHPFEYLRDSRSFDASGYDLVITDFEPISARIAKLNRIPSIGIGHQYAFPYDIPMSDANILSMFIIKHFAPADISIGLHWHHFNQPILPPIVPRINDGEVEIDNKKILVYLPFEELVDIESLLIPFASHDFYIYHKDVSSHEIRNLHLRPYSRKNFLRDLMECNGVITNAGFELASESLHLGKRLLVKPLAGQMEQSSNALAISMLKLGMTMQKLDPNTVSRFLKIDAPEPMGYPDVAGIIAEWIGRGNWGKTDDLVQKTWAMTKGTIIK